ncbi:MAG TPA: F0F1 ATP synthase subunit delta, partial [Burkholderiales bacterium]|nr:F0F1 ATP synthase subunit delta [Burkholderiales bacterium]
SLAAAQLKEDYERRTADWHAERERASAGLAREIETERARRLEELRAELAQEREKQGALERQHLRELERRAERAARERAAAFGARLLRRVANPGLDAAICAMVLEDLARLEPAQRQGLAAASTGDGLTVDITSARALGEPQRQALVDALGQILETPPRAVDFHEDPTLIAGVAVGMGAWVLQANLRDELKFFTEAERDAA